MQSSLFADAANFDQRFVDDAERILEIVNALKALGLRIVASFALIN